MTLDSWYNDLPSILYDILRALLNDCMKIIFKVVVVFFLILIAWGTLPVRIWLGVWLGHFQQEP